MSTTPQYVPAGCNTLDKTTFTPQIRLGIQGAPGEGKTWAALTFPNPVVVNFDRGLGAHAGRADVVEAPFWDGAFCDKLVKRDGQKAPPNKKDAFLLWLRTEAVKIPAGCTLVIDGNTSLQKAHETQYNLNPATTSSGAIDARAIWRDKIEYFGEIMDILKELNCHVVYISHEIPDRNDKGDLNGKVRPLISGQFGDQLAGHFTDWFRAVAYDKPTNQIEKDKLKQLLKLDDKYLDSLIAASTSSAIYLWQTETDQVVSCKCSSMYEQPKYVLANYNTFAQFKKK